MCQTDILTDYGQMIFNAFPFHIVYLTLSQSYMALINVSMPKYLYTYIYIYIKLLTLIDIMEL